MSKLNFTPVERAFTLGSSQIKDTQEEIAKLTKLILESNTKPTSNVSNPAKTPNPTNDNFNQQTSNYMRVGYPDNQSAVFRPNNNFQEDIDYNLMKVISHPKFDDIVKSYVLINHPEWLLKETTYTPQTNKSYFGNKYASTVCSDVRNSLK